MLATPVCLVAIQTIRDFQRIGESGRAGFSDAAGVAMSMVKPVGIGCFAFLAVLGAATVYEWLNAPVMEVDDPAPAGEPARPWASWIAGLSPLLLIPAVSLAYFTKNTAGILMQVAASLNLPGPQTSVAGMDLSTFSQMVANRLVLQTLGGGALALAIAASAGIGIVMHRLGTRSAATERVSRIVTIAGGLIGIALAIALTIDLRAIARAATRQLL